MVVYVSNTKVIGPVDLSAEDDDVATSLAGLVNDYIETLDSTTNEILDIDLKVVGQMGWVIISSGT